MHETITISPDIQSGTPVFRGTRVPVKNLFDYLKEGDGINTFLDDFPAVKKEQVLALLGFAGLVLTLNHNKPEDDKAAA